MLLAAVWVPAADNADEDPPSYDFYGLPVVETNTVFLLDYSGSMRGDRIRQLRKEMASVLEGMGEKRRFGIILFTGLGTLRYPLKGLAPADKRRKQRALKFLKRPPNGKTPMLKAFRDVSTRLVEKAATPEQRVDAIYLLSDGEASDAKPEALLKEVDRMNRKAGVIIHSISIGTKSETLAELARMHSGRHKTVKAKPPAERPWGPILKRH